MADTGYKRTISCERQRNTLDPIMRSFKLFPSDTPPAEAQPDTPRSPLNKRIPRENILNGGAIWGKAAIRAVQDPLPDNTERITWSYGGIGAFLEDEDDDQASSSDSPLGLDTRQINTWAAAYFDNSTYPAADNSYDRLVFGSGEDNSYNIARAMSEFAYTARREGGSEQYFEFYNFKTSAPYASSYLLDEILDSLGVESGRQEKTVTRPATINPEYNYYLQNYERAIGSDRVPEAVLPNMYIYSFMSDNNNNLNTPDWQDGEREAELTSQNYDRPITLGEFSGETLPRLTSEDEGFLTYLENYSNAVQNVVIDQTSPLAQNYKTSISPASEMGFYNSMNGRKTQFPMYIEIHIPTLPVTENSITHMMGTSTTSTGMINSLISSDSTDEQMRHRSPFFIDRNSNRNSEASVFKSYTMPNADAALNRGKQLLSIRSIDMNSKVYNFSTWMDGVLDDIQTLVVSPDGRERVEGQCARFRDRMMVQAMRSNIENLSNSRALKYTDMLSGKLCENETIAYKLTKKNSNDDILQTFYLPNTSTENIIKFVDTQVKYNKTYKYDLTGYAVVYGSKYKFVTESRTYPTLGETDDQGVTIPVPNQFAPISFTFDVETIPNPKVIEYQIFSELYQVPTDQFLSSGVSMPPVKVFDRPPMPPEMQVHPYRNNYQQVLLNIQPGMGSRIGQEAIKYIPLSDEDLQAQYNIAIYQKQFENFDLLFPKLEFKSEGSSEVRRIEIFRATKISKNVADYDDAYKSFGDVPYKVLDTSGNQELPPNEIAQAFDFVDTLTPNITYYYTCRAVDMHGKKSNPAAIYEVKLNYDKGLYYPTIELFEVNPTPTKRPSKQMARFLEIRACDIQTYVNNRFEPNDNGEEVLVSDRGFVDKAEHDVSTNHFLVRLTSRDTGRKLDFKLVFSKPSNGE